MLHTIFHKDANSSIPRNYSSEPWYIDIHNGTVYLILPYTKIFPGFTSIKMRELIWYQDVVLPILRLSYLYHRIPTLVRQHLFTKSTPGYVLCLCFISYWVRSVTDDVRYICNIPCHWLSFSSVWFKVYTNNRPSFIKAQEYQIKSISKSMLVDKNFLTWLLTGWW